MYNTSVFDGLLRYILKGKEVKNIMKPVGTVVSDKEIFTVLQLFSW